MDYSQISLEKHKQFKGKIAITSKFGAIKTKEDLSVAYTPGVAAVSTLLINIQNWPLIIQSKEILSL